MDLICSTYSNSSDEESDPKPKPIIRPEFNPPPPTKRLKPNYNLPTEAPIAGRYISKRERALMAQPSPAFEQDPNPNPNPSFGSSSVLATIKDSDIPRDVLSLLRREKDDHFPKLSQISERQFIGLHSHTKAVNAVSWSKTHAHLLASAAMDHSICIWNVWSRDQKLARIFRFHNAAVKDVKWAREGISVLSCGYDCASRLIDVDKGIETQIFKEDQVVGVIKFHPENNNLFLSGGSKGRIRFWDIRASKVVHEYIRGLGPILDLEFTPNGKSFISSSDISGSNVSENSIIVWDVSRQVPLSNQVRDFFLC